MKMAVSEACELFNLQGEIQVWQRTDLRTKTLKTSMKGGPEWSRVRARVTVDAKT